MGEVKAVRILDLTEKQRRFVEAYLGKASGNGTEAASLAGYDGDRKSLSVIAANNLKKPSIRLAIEERTKDDGTIASREERQQFLTRVMRTDFRKMPERLKAVELLCRMHGDFVEKHTVDMTVGRKERQEEIEHFLSRLQDRSVSVVSSGNPLVSVIDATAKSIAESIDEASVSDSK